MSLFLLTSPRNPFEEIVGMHGGSAGPDGDHGTAFFPQAQKAIECALALQSRLAEHNRANAEKPLSLRMGIHASAGNGPASDQELEAAIRVMDSAPIGRVFLSRQAYTQSQCTRVCAFIPLGQEFFAGLPDPLEIFEAIRLVGRSRIASPPLVAEPRTELQNARAPTTIRGLDAPPATAISTDAPAAEAKPLEITPLMLAAIALGTLVLLAAKNGLGMILSPLNIVDYVFLMAGALLFGLTGSESRAIFGGVLTQLAMPLAAATHFHANRRPIAARISWFWFGQCLFSLGIPLAMGADPNTYGGWLRSGMLVLLNAIGLAAHALGVGHFLVALGCLAMSFAIVTLAWPHLPSSAE